MGQEALDGRFHRTAPLSFEGIPSEASSGISPRRAGPFASES